MIELIGHRAVKKQLADLIINSQLGHAYIFDGIDGIGKTTAAKWFAAAALCKEGKGTACGVCDSCKKIEAEGIKTVIITDEYAGRDGKSQSLADADAAADAVVTGGNANQVIILPKMDKVIGTLDYVTKIAGASEETLRSDGSLEVELQVITGATNETGFNRLSAR